jgi:arylsulfatase
MSEASKLRPNVLLFVADGLRTDALGCYGSTRGATPHLDDFARAGVVFSQAFCTHSVCMPTRASILTGRYPHIHGVWANGLPLRRTEVTLPQVLGEAGYATCASGKVHLEPQQPYGAVAPRIEGPYYGFQEVHLSENALGEEYLNFIDGRFSELSQRARDRDRVPVEAHELQWITDQTLDFIGRQSTAGQPFFAMCSFHELIPPCTPPPEYTGLYDPADMALPKLLPEDLDGRPPFYRECYEGYSRLGRQPDEAELRQHIASYYDQLRFVDHQFGRLLAGLAESGIAENTIVLFTADHGLSLNDHYQWRHGPFLFDEVIKVPQVWRGPGLGRGLATAGLVEQVDLLPTLADLCGVAAPAGVQGVTLRPLLQREPGAHGKDAVLIQERHAPDLAARGLDPESVWQVGLRTAEWKLIHYVGQPWGELYDLCQDPGEFRNLWADPAYRLQRQELESQLMSRLAETQDPLPENHFHY